MSLTKMRPGGTNARLRSRNDLDEGRKYASGIHSRMCHVILVMSIHIRVG